MLSFEDELVRDSPLAPYARAYKELRQPVVPDDKGRYGRADVVVWIPSSMRPFDPTNRRRKLVHITPEGRSTLDEALPVQRQVEDTMTASLTQSERAELNRLLAKVLALQGDGSTPGELEER
ncbi:MarR family winged helix-turn-helix transcriptional regulator [Streptomyces axinellae]|uniref:MarR family transcriptional regulator n=1 Tax=Streptomyces axinellae TaxID=552788 RepID=A0ABP6C1U5_9ACTN